MSFRRVLLAVAVLVVIAGGLAFVGLLRALGTFASPAAGDVRASLVVDGRTRTYLVHVPPGSNTSARRPLVFVLHGATQTPEGAERMSEMSAKADRERFIAVYPAGTGRLSRVPTWNAGACCAYAMRHDVNDVEFFRALIAKLEQDYPIDPARIYATGISNGAMMAYRLACEMSETFAAVAPVEGAQDVDCRPSAPVSVIVFHGTADRLVPFEGGSTRWQLGSTRSDTPVTTTVAFWAREDGCAPAPDRDDRTARLHVETYAGCRAGTAVALYVIDGGRHMWPGRPLSGNDVPATDLIWSFFATHPKKLKTEN